MLHHQINCADIYNLLSCSYPAAININQYAEGRKASSTENVHEEIELFAAIFIFGSCSHHKAPLIHSIDQYVCCENSGVWWLVSGLAE